jgi:hypothetical protein
MQPNKGLERGAHAQLQYHVYERGVYERVSLQCQKWTISLAQREA